MACGLLYSLWLWLQGYIVKARTLFLRRMEKTVLYKTWEWERMKLKSFIDSIVQLSIQGSSLRMVPSYYDTLSKNLRFFSLIYEKRMQVLYTSTDEKKRRYILWRKIRKSVDPESYPLNFSFIHEYKARKYIQFECLYRYNFWPRRFILIWSKNF